MDAYDTNDTMLYLNKFIGISALASIILMTREKDKILHKYFISNEMTDQILTFYFLSYINGKCLQNILAPKKDNTRDTYSQTYPISRYVSFEKKMYRYTPIKWSRPWSQHLNRVVVKHIWQYRRLDYHKQL